MLWKIKKHVHQFKDDYEVLDEIEHIKTEVKSVISSAEEEMDIRDLQKELSELKERTEKCIEKMEEIKKETEV